MNFNISKEWLLKHAEEDDKVEISAGRIGLEDLIAHKKALGASKEPMEAPVPAFGKLINLCRRSKGLSMEQLAERARVDLSELINIEHDLRYRPEPRTVYQLSGVLDLPNEKLLQLSGNMVIRDMRFEQSVVKFAARSESVDKLSREEHRALEEFVKYLSEQK
jgi:HTH-type transcriptional regulator, competence development regulator